MKKIIALLLALVMVFALAACGQTTPGAENTNPGTSSPGAENPAGSTTPAEDNDGLKYLTAGEKYPAKTIKIGVPLYDTTDSSAIAGKAYFDYLEQYLNIEFIYSEAIASAEQQIAFVENCYVAGCQAIMGSYDVIGHSIIDTCAEYGMYFLMGPSDVARMEGDLYEQYKDNEYWLGGYTQGDLNYYAGYACAEYLMEKGVKKCCYASGGALFGVEMFVRGQQGFNQAFADADYEIEIVELPGFPTDEWFAQQASILADPTIEAVSGLATPNFWAQPLANAGRDDILLVSGSGAFDETNMSAMESGVLNFTNFGNVEEQGMCIVMLINALNGDMDMVKPNGVVELIDANLWVYDNYEDAKAVYDITTGTEHLVDINDICSMIKALNPDATFDTMLEIYGETDLDAILARHEANR